MKHLISLYKIESKKIFDEVSNDEIYQFWLLVKEVYDKNGTIYFAGNGGNVGFISNMYTDFLIHPFTTEDKSVSLNAKRLKCINLCDSTSTLTGISNDIGFSEIFSEQLYFAGENDLLIGITGSGTSKNIVRAFEVCRNKGAKIICLTKNVNFNGTKIVISGVSEFPGQTGKNMANFHFEDCIAKITHIITGMLKQYVSKST